MHSAACPTIAAGVYEGPEFSHCLQCGADLSISDVSHLAGMCHVARVRVLVRQ